MHCDLAHSSRKRADNIQAPFTRPSFHFQTNSHQSLNYVSTFVTYIAPPLPIMSWTRLFNVSGQYTVLKINYGSNNAKHFHFSFCTERTATLNSATKEDPTLHTKRQCTLPLGYIEDLKVAFTT